MPKVLCLIGLSLAVLILLLFSLDLIMGLAGLAIAPFGMASILIDVIFIIVAGVLAALSWLTFKEQR